MALARRGIPWRRRSPWLGGAVLAVAFAASQGGAAGTPADVRIVPPGQANDSPLAVMFPHRLHEEFACFACHPAFAAPGRSLGGHAAFAGGAACGLCHNGSAAFTANGNSATCGRCHPAFVATP